MKKYLALILALVLCSALCIPALAVDYTPYTYSDPAGFNGSIVFEETRSAKANIKIEELWGEITEHDVTMVYVKPESKITVTEECAFTFFKLIDSGIYVDMGQPVMIGEEEAVASDIFSHHEPGTYIIMLDYDANIYLAFDEGTAITTPIPAAPSFTDVPADAYYAASVAWAVEKGITNGTSDTTFSPANTCTNAQILTFMWRANGSPDVTANVFSNLNGDEYYFKAANWAYENKMITGTSFNANEPCTRSMTVEYFWKQAGSPVMTDSDKFTDVSADDSYAQAVAWAVENGVTNGTSDTTFSPSATCTRGQIVTFLNRALVK